MNYSILRGRFQPFSKLHYECVKGFYQEFVTDPDPSQWPWLVLCIVRDHETLLSRHGLIRRHAEGPYLRHLSMFNPVPIALCEYYIREGLRYFLPHDVGPEDKEESKRFRLFLSQRLMIQAVPLKLGQVLESLQHDGDFTVNEIMELLYENPGPPDKDLANVLRLLPIIVHETLTLHEHDKAAWFLPVLDREDLKDFDHISRHGYSVQLKYHADIASFYDCEEGPTVFLRPQLDILEDIGCLSPYGVFIYYAYLTFAAKTTTLTGAEINKELQRVTAFIRNQVSPDCFTDYIGRIETIKESLDIKKMPDEEKKLLQSPQEFVALSKQYLKVPERDEYLRLKREGTELGVRLLAAKQLRQVFGNVALESALETLQSWQALSGEPAKRANEAAKVIGKIKLLLEKQPDKEVGVDVREAWELLLGAIENKQRVAVTSNVVSTLTRVLE